MSIKLKVNFGYRNMHAARGSSAPRSRRRDIWVFAALDLLRERRQDEWMLTPQHLYCKFGRPLSPPFVLANRDARAVPLIGFRYQTHPKEPREQVVRPISPAVGKCSRPVFSSPVSSAGSLSRFSSVCFRLSKPSRRSSRLLVPVLAGRTVRSVAPAEVLRYGLSFLYRLRDLGIKPVAHLTKPMTGHNPASL
jgi:hypothetical protein